MPFEEDFHLVRLLFVEHQPDPFTDELRRRFKEASVDGNHPVFVDPAPHFFSEVVFKIGRSSSDHFDMGSKAVERGHGSSGVGFMLVVRLQPLLKEAVDFGKCQ